ncbi:MAG: exodeoxyribonuclease III [Thermodesulfovibrionales bacterium]|nr:exodeoxyribonuclease III [Thermodesulfovibrionales bacterium]
MKIATYNVNSIKSRIGLLMDWLKRRQYDVDVLCLQELKVVDNLFPYDEFSKVGYQSAVFGQKTYNGVAICSRREMSNVVRGFGVSDFDNQSRFIMAEISGLTVCCIYAPHGDLRGTNKFEYKMKWYDAFRNFIKDRLQLSKTLLCGDFNVALQDIDVYDSDILKDTIGTMPEERQALQTIINLGFVDTVRMLHPNEKLFTWWDYTGGAVWKNEGMRIDYILCSEDLKGAIKSADIDTWPRRRHTPTPSDHTPVIIELDV